MEPFHAQLVHSIVDGIAVLNAVLLAKSLKFCLGKCIVVIRD